MATIEPTGQILGATVRGVNLARPLGSDDFATILLALGHHGVLRFPDQRLDAVDEALSSDGRPDLRPGVPARRGAGDGRPVNSGV